MQRDGDDWLLSGLLRPDEVRERTGIAVPEGRYETLGGFLAQQLARLPAEGDHADVEGHRLTVTRTEGRRVAELRAVPQPQGDDLPARQHEVAREVAQA
jgi:CBS domain containing-hemolysin-like protein